MPESMEKERGRELPLAEDDRKEFLEIISEIEALPSEENKDNFVNDLKKILEKNDVQATAKALGLNSSYDFLLGKPEQDTTELKKRMSDLSDKLFNQLRK